MIILQVKELTKSFGVNNIFSSVSFVIEKGDRVGLIGKNGAGKTTLLKCITGEESADSGAVMINEQHKVGFLQQISQYADGTSLMSVMLDVFADVFVLRDQMSLLENKMSQKLDDTKMQKTISQYSRLRERYELEGGFDYESSVRKVAFGLGFTDADLMRDINSFSGGEKTRASLAKLLLREPDILLLDEPTNHLDIAATEWLEGYLKGYRGAIVLISHDRYFLDQITNRTVEMNGGRIELYPGNYSRYLELKQQRQLTLERAYEKQQKEIKATEEYIDRYRAGIKSKQARGRQSRLDRLERIEKLPQQRRLLLRTDDQKIDESGNLVLQLDDVRFGFDGKNLLNAVELLIQKKEKVVLIGGNGAGKSTLLKLVLGHYQPEQGKIRLGSRVKIGYFDQQHAGLHPEMTVLQELTATFDMTDGEARNHLAEFLFTGDDVFKLVGQLSGGERGRLSFLKLFLSEPNFMLLDEPTNHLDIMSKEIIEEYLNSFSGTVLAVSHDRYFLDKIAGRIVELYDGRLINYYGNYSYYKEKKALQRAEQERLRQLKKNEELNKRKKQQQTQLPKVNKAKIKEKISCLEQQIEQQEVQLKELSAMLADSENYRQGQLIKDLSVQYKELELSIAESYEQWEHYSELLAESLISDKP